MKNIAIITVLSLMLFNCSTNVIDSNSNSEKSNDKSKLSLGKTEKTNEADHKHTMTLKITPYSAPKSIKELYKTKFIVDTMYYELITNKLGDDDNEYFVNFNKIIGQSESTEYEPNQLLPVKKNDYFDPVFKDGNDELILPFYVDEERENTILTIWKYYEKKIEYKTYIKNLFLTKYSSIRIIDKESFDNNQYILGETYSPDEGSLNRIIWTAKLTSNNELLSKKSYNLGEINTDSIISKCSINESDGKLFIMNGNERVDEIK